MKKTLIVVIVLAAVILIARPFFCNGKKEDKSANGKPEEKTKPISAENSDAFNNSFTQLLDAYNEVKDALVASDAAKATTAAQTLRTASDSLKVNEIKGDSTGVIKQNVLSYTSTITGSAQALVTEKDIEGKRKEFANIADAMYTLIHVVQYKGKKLYWAFCPMAFNNKGAYWISYERDIKNPYFGSKMMTCGSVEDSIDYSK